MHPILGFVDFPYEKREGMNVFEWENHTYTTSLPSYQMDNLGLALETCHALGIDLEVEWIQKSIDEFSWLGRFTQLNRPYKVILDGAHNMDGIQALVKSISKWDGDIYFSALSDKDVEEMLKILETLHCPITLVSIDSYRCYPLETLSYPLISKEELIERINHPVTDMLICGSLYFIGEVLEKVDG